MMAFYLLFSLLPIVLNANEVMSSVTPFQESNPTKITFPTAVDITEAEVVLMEEEAKPLSRKLKSITPPTYRFTPARGISFDFVPNLSPPELPLDSPSLAPIASPPQLPSESPPFPPIASPPEIANGLWCVAKPSVPDKELQEAMDYACGGGGADCEEIGPDGSCYYPDNLVAHASFAFNSYWQKTKHIGGTCSFDGTAMLIDSDPSSVQCQFVHS